MSFRVYDQRCKSCIFGKNSPVTPERFAELKAAWEQDDTVQECHTATLREEHIGCRGHYEAARNGGIPHPIFGIMIGLGFEGLSISDMMQVAERMGWVSFEPLPDEAKEVSDANESQVVS